METKEETNVSISQKAIKGVHSQTVIVALKAILSLVYFSIMSRLLTPDDFGYFALITAVTTILNSLSEAGLGSSVIQKKDVNKDFFIYGFHVELVFGSVFFSSSVCICKRIFKSCMRI